MESVDALYYIDQHALAERILFEKIRIGIKNPE
jgi:DNA mismatch repair ATPase MutL